MSIRGKQHSSKHARPPRREEPPSPRGPLLSREEKQAMILAHAQRRQPVDPIHHASLYVGVFFCVAVVIGVWYYAVGSGLGSTLAQSIDAQKADVQNVADQFKTTNAPGSNAATAPDSLTGQLDALNQQAIRDMGASTSTLVNLMVSEVASTTAQVHKPTTRN